MQFRAVRGRYILLTYKHNFATIAEKEPANLQICFFCSTFAANLKKKQMIVLPTTYMGSVEWYKRYLANPQEVQIEVMESFPKQTYRNRCTISQAIGRKGDEAIGKEPLTLSVPVKRADSKQLTRDVEISYQQRWQHQHWIALVSAYKRTPYFDYYADFFRPFYEQETRFLVDFNEKIHEVIVALVQNCVELGSSSVELSSAEDTTPHHTTLHYTTLRHTSDWQGLDLEPCFGNGQSILDLLFEYGPETPLALCRMV